MRTMTTDTLKMTIFQEVMNLDSTDKLQKVYDYIASLSAKKEKELEYTMPMDLLQSVAEYTAKVVKEDGPLFSTSEVFDHIDQEMGWK